MIPNKSYFILGTPVQCEKVWSLRQIWNKQGNQFGLGFWTVAKFLLFKVRIQFKPSQIWSDQSEPVTSIQSGTHRTKPHNTSPKSPAGWHQLCHVNKQMLSPQKRSTNQNKSHGFFVNMHTTTVYTSYRCLGRFSLYFLNFRPHRRPVNKYIRCVNNVYIIV